VQVLRLLETFSLPELSTAVRQALRFPAIAYGAVKHVLLCVPPISCSLRQHGCASSCGGGPVASLGVTAKQQSVE
jgi:hypothetical protein